MSDLSDKRSYYNHQRYKLPENQFQHPAPFDISPVNRELSRIGGEVNGQPFLRVVWGGERVSKGWLKQPDGTSVFTEQPTYIAALFETVTGWAWKDEGQIRRVKEQAELPPDVFAWQTRGTVALGRMRWVFEMFYTPERLVAAGKITVRELRDGASEMYCAAPGKGGLGAYTGLSYERNGDYLEAYTFQNAGGWYDEPDKAWLERVEREMGALINERESGQAVFLRMLEDYEARQDRAKRRDGEKFDNFYYDDLLPAIERRPRGLVISA